MIDRPIFFNAEMVRAILEGRKTQTRRIIDEKFRGLDNENWKESTDLLIKRCPFGQPGDRLWVRETCADVNASGIPAIAYRADKDVLLLTEDESFHDENGEVNYNDPRIKTYPFAQWYSDLVDGTEGRWRPSIHMPRWASRISLEITNVRVERLHSISEADAKTEGVFPAAYAITHPEAACRVGFGDLWCSIYGEESWTANPWVWVIEFTARIRRK
ncbi:hypothetical protein [Escherichia coli]|uniref:hypothetical protein n=1 Tax=Escherichia coli TaxID=562 RepID=UPI0027DEAD40|nr:hypothetical protein [Escherichia coli]